MSVIKINKENLDKFKKENIFVKDKEDAIYIYREIVNDRAQIGIVACVAVDDNLNGVVKKHEYTKPDKELDRTNHIKYCNANTGTVLLTYKNDEEIDKMVKEAEANKEADLRRKEEADVKNEAEQLVFQTEKSMKDLGDKIDAKDKEKAEFHRHKRADHGAREPCGMSYTKAEVQSLSEGALHRAPGQRGGEHI